MLIPNARPLAAVVALAVLAAACSSSSDDEASPADDAAVTTTAGSSDDTPADGEPSDEGSPGEDLPVESQPGVTPVTAPEPTVPDGPLGDDIAVALDALIDTGTGLIDGEALATLADSGDARLAWVVSDLLRFLSGGSEEERLRNAFTDLTGVTVTGTRSWNFVTNHLIAWDTPDFPGYVEWKGELYTLVDERWAFVFDDPESEIDYRWVSWGGVLIDDRELENITVPCPLGCIPAINDPAVTDAAGGDWYPDDMVVFGVVVNGEARAYPRHQMEVHEMVNDSLGGRRLGIPYCTLCGSAQAYLTDAEALGAPIEVIEAAGGERAELRTSGLLSRSNKVMYEFYSQSVFDTFTGEAVSGPLREAGVTLEQVSVVTTTWGQWKDDHPDTTILAEDGGLGRDYPFDPLGGRDDNGPIFPVGDVDERLGVQEPVLGVVLDDGTAVAFPVADALLALAAGEAVEFAGITLVEDAGGVRVESPDDVASHQSFWFAWSQFRPTTELWERES